jgi:hypothetical protein
MSNRVYPPRSERDPDARLPEDRSVRFQLLEITGRASQWMPVFDSHALNYYLELIWPQLQLQEETLMNRPVRYSLILIGMGMLILTLGFYFQMSWAQALWPWPDSRLSYIFIASITAAMAAPALWMGITGELGAAAGGAINLGIQAVGMTVFLFQQGIESNDSRLMVYGVVFGIFALLNAVIFLRTRQTPIQDVRPMPRAIRISFVVFVMVLFLVTVLLLFKAPVIFPWVLKPTSSVMFGWVFAGTVVYFFYALTRSHWHDAKGQLLGFLAYDLILIIPFLNHFSGVLQEHRLSLIIYTAVLIYSGALAIYFLFINKTTRTWDIQRSNATP